MGAVCGSCLIGRSSGEGERLGVRRWREEDREANDAVLEERVREGTAGRAARRLPSLPSRICAEKERSRTRGRESERV